MSVLIARNQFQAFMEVGEQPAYELIGEGFTSLTESKNPKEYTRQYVHEQTERTDVTGFAPAYDYSMDMHSGNAVCAQIAKVSDEELTGTAAQVNICCVNLFEPGTTDGTYTAWQRTYAIIPDGKGDGFDALVYTGSLRAAGDAVKGTFAMATKKFTADAA